MGSKREQYNAQITYAFPAQTDHAHRLLTFIEHRKIGDLRSSGISVPKTLFSGQWVMHATWPIMKC